MSKRRDPKVRCFDVTFGGTRESTERPGKPFRLHCFNVEFRSVIDVEEAVRRGILWLRDNGVKPVFERELFSIQMMEEIVETDPDTGDPLTMQPF